jgi:acyl-CoA thioesterase
VTPDELAAACAEAMWAGDSASRALGMVVESVGPGRAVLSMTIRDDMTNGHGIGHGGFVFSLADSAFAFACNARNVVTVAQACDIVFVAPTHAGYRLVATAVERHLFRRNGVYDITVRLDDAVVAEFRGRSFALGGTLVPPDAPAEGV